MIGILMDSLVLIFIMVSIWQIKLIKPLEGFQDDYLSIGSSTALKGIFSIVVIFHHLAQRTSAGVLFHEFANVGYFAVSIFFFISGYALLKKHISDDTYRENFLKRRFPTVFIPYVVINICYWIYYALTRKVYSIKDFIVSILEGSPLAYFSWYVVAILVFYIVFAILMKVCKKHYSWIIIGCSLYTILWIILCSSLKFGGWWYNATHLLVLGMVWALEEKKILWFIKKRYRALLPLVTFFFLFFYRYPNSIIKFFPVRGIKLMVPMATALLFVLLVILFLLKWRIGNRILNYLGTISLELYLSQGIFVLFGEEYRPISNNFLFSVMVLGATILFSHFLHKLLRQILGAYKKLVK